MSTDLHRDGGSRGGLKETDYPARVQLAWRPQRRLPGEIHLCSALGQPVCTASESVAYSQRLNLTQLPNMPSINSLYRQEAIVDPV